MQAAMGRDRRPRAAWRAGTAGWLLCGLLLGCAAPSKPPPAPAPSPSIPAPPRVPAPFLDDYGRLLVEAMEYPWSALGRVNTGGRGFCTGVLIGPDLVLASARCLYNATEGRWWRAPDLHFVAAYQRDVAAIHAPVADYEVGSGFSGGGGMTLGNVASNWALLRLAAPLGHEAGWLAVRRLDRALLGRLQDGGGFAVQAGYRWDWAHAITVKLRCLGDGPSPLSPSDPGCRSAANDAALPLLVYLDGALHAVTADPGLPYASPAGRPPPPGGLAAPQPRDTIARLLRHLGYLREEPGAVAGAELAAAIRRFERLNDLPESGRPSLALLGRLLDAVRREPLPGAPVSLAPALRRPLGS